jgi:cytochrome P450
MTVFDPFASEFVADPYPFYDRLRESNPLFFHEPLQMWFAVDHASCVALLKSNSLGHESHRVGPREQLGSRESPAVHSPLAEMQSRWMLLRDPPTHTRLRSLVHGAFTPPAMDRLRSQIQSAVDQLIATALRKSEIDIVEDLAGPLPLIVIADMFGVPGSDRHALRRWSRELADTCELTASRDVLDRGAAAAVEISALLHELVKERRRQPRQDLLSALVHVEARGDALTEEELIATCTLLLVAGHETSTNFIGNGMLALLRHPDQLELLKAHPELGPPAIEELLRYDSPVQTTFRTVLHDTEYDGRRLQKGATVCFMLGAANHDPAIFEEPRTLDITRDPNPHLSFSYGIHYCLGAPLARLEGQLAIQTLLRRAAHIELLDGSPTYRKTWAARGLEALPVRLG